ncbi:hypothetical protein MGG_07334 [Pyricularia oryzae 70-15]|uniref:Extracellular membrane protein CFEM domain-containing protein n=1 Tax=Pyricularia oryzae (strain 70-15 / ATCC MYA-4617 / FGSC 8958) TaxID=242507 RepID=G4MVD7_PYRO7|nr:uncharacterized protein MGG_07334 [Pyricularia oryzae 70-15]EHA55763.1 hypothetical protein MGG_07334 [Pyricularia oryzae 70-15]KAI7912472.1 hypothetical protein M9X92_010001 [Pyricularia oryzae]KAI7915569.1 hypothetical protein M0657_008990 [Pyricularia oryzae]
MPGGRRHGSRVTMPSINMAALKPILLLIAIWTMAPIQVCAADATTTATAASPVATLVPSCARGCFQLFLDVHKFTGSCGNSPSLDCLCGRYSSSGATIGEGAVQCIVAEAETGTCSKDDASQSVISKAYSACNEQPNAVTPTLKTIVATLVTSTTAIPTNSPTPTTMITSSRPPTGTNAPWGTPTPTSTPQESNKSSAALNGSQVAGVTIGAVSGVFILVAFVFIARCSRKKHLNNVAARDKNVSFDSERSAPGPGMDGRQGSMQISAPLHVASGPAAWAPQPYESMAAAPAPRLSTIGQALTPAGNTATHFDNTTSNNRSTRHPTLTPRRRESAEFFAALARNEQPEQVLRQQSKPQLNVSIPANVSGINRDSQVTEFAEDGEDMDPETAGGNIWRPPPTDPTSASTYYVADKWGNWRRKSVSTREPNTSYGNMPPPRSASSATVPPLKLGKKLPGQGDGSPGAASSVYSVFTPPQSEYPGADNPMPPLPPFPKSSYAKMLEMNRALEASSNGPTPQRNASTASNGPIGARSAWPKSLPRDSQNTTTTIADDDDLTSPNHGNSMVMPVTADGIRKMLGGDSSVRPRSTIPPPVSYNNMPGSTRSPPAGSSPARPSSSHSWTSAATNWQNEECSPLSPILGRMPPQGVSATRAQVHDPHLLSPPIPSQLRMPTTTAFSNTNGRSLTRPGNTTRPGPSLDDEPVVFPAFPPSPDSFRSTGSGLLAKRLGAERAAGLSLETEVQPATRAHWMRQLSPSSPSSDPAAGLPLPVTPGWEPKLTPTRRGDDLFLKVA